jgi:hypothetical protein
MAAPLSRSDLEASLYMQLHPCEYGATGFEPEHTPHVDGDQLRSAGALRLVTVTTAGDGWACQVYGPRGRGGGCQVFRGRAWPARSYRPARMRTHIGRGTSATCSAGSRSCRPSMVRRVSRALTWRPSSPTPTSSSEGLRKHRPRPSSSGAPLRPSTSTSPTKPPPSATATTTGVAPSSPPPPARSTNDSPRRMPLGPRFRQGHWPGRRRPRRLRPRPRYRRGRHRG